MDGSVKSKALGHLDTEDKLNLFEKSAQKFSKTEIKVSLLSTVSLLALTSCGGGGGGVFGAFGGGGGSLLGGMLLKGPISGARVFQDLNLNNVFDAGEPFAFTQPDGSYSLQTQNNTAPILTDGGVDTTTGANAGAFKFNPTENISTVTPVSVVITQINDDIDPNTAFTKFSSLSAPISFDNYNPIQSAADAGGTNVDAAIVDAVGAQMQTTINGLSTLLEEISSITSTDPYQNAVDAIVAEINSGNTINFEDAADLVSIFNRTSLSSSEFAPVVTSVTNVIAEVNKQLFELFTEDGGNFLDADARGIALLAQTDLVDAISNLASSPVEDAASSLQAQFSAANVTALATDLANKVPEYDPVTGAASIIASMDRVKGEIGSTVTSNNLTSNDVVVSGTAPLVAVGLSTSKTGEDINLNTPFTKDIGKSANHGFSTGQKVTGSGIDYYLAKLDNDHFVLATSSENAQAVSIQTATFDESNGTYSLEGNTLINGDQLTLFDTENGTIGESHEINVAGDQFSLVGDPSIVSNGAQISFVKTSGLFQSDNATPNLTYKKFLLSKTDSNNIVATLNPNDGTVSIDIPNGTNPGTYTFFYQVADQEGKVAVGPINVDVPVKKPTLNIQDTITDVPEQKDGNYLEIDLGQYLDFDLSGSSTGNLSFRGFNQSDLYQQTGVSADNNIGLLFKSIDSSTPTMTMLPETKDRQIVITNESENKSSIKDNLVIRLDKDFVGTIDLTAFITVTNNNKFSSATDVLKFNVSPVADTPVITLTDRSTIDGVDVEGIEDLPIRIFKTETGDSILSVTSGDIINTETLSIIVKRNIVLSDGSTVSGDFVDAETSSNIGEAIQYDFGTGLEDALEFNQSQFDNLSVKLPTHYEGNATLKAVTKSTHGSTEAFSSAQDVVVKALPSVDDISIIVNEPAAGVEDTNFYVNLTANQVDVGEDLRIFIGNFERQDSSGNYVAVDPSDIGGVSGFRPSVFATYSNNFFMFSSLPGDDGNPVALQSGQNLNFEFLPLTDFNGNLKYEVFARTIESDGVSKDTSIVSKIQNFDPRSEDPNVELGGNLTTNEYQGQSDYVSQKLGIGDLQVDQADSLEMMRATIKFFNNTEFEADPSTATLLSSVGNYVTLDTSSVPANLLSNLTIDNSTPGQFVIDVTPTLSDGVVTDSSVDNLKSIMSNIGVLPPEDYSTNSGSDIRVEIQIQAKELGAEFSAPSGGDFTLIVNPVASKPTVVDSNSGIRSGLEDTLTKINDGLTFTVDDLDGSESIVAVNVSGVSAGFAIVDASNNAIGVSDGAGTVTLTNLELVSGQSNQYKLSSDVYLRAPNDLSGNVSLTVSAIAKENNSGATFVSDNTSINITIAPDADEPAVSVPSSSNVSPIKIGEYVSGSTYANTSDYIKLTTSISELNPDEVMEGIIRFKQSGEGNSATFLLNDSSSPVAINSGHADYKAGYDTYVLSEDDVKNKLAGASFRPPEGVINKDNDPSYDPSYIVEVIGRSIDGADVGTTEKSITYQIAAVAKAPIIKNESGDDLTSTYEIGDVIKTGDGSHKMKIALDVEASGEEQITLLMTNLPSSLSDYLSFENAQGTAIGAKNADGSVYVLTMDQLDVDGVSGISASSEFFYLVLSSGAQINELNNNYNFTGNLNDVGNSSGFQVVTNENGNRIIKNTIGEGTTLQQKTISVDLTGFALDTIGGTTASKGLTGSGDIYYIQGDPLVIDFNGGSLDDSNFTSLPNALDINMDGTLDTVYMPNSNTGLLIFDKDGDQFSTFVDQNSSRLSLKDHIFSEFFKFGNEQGTSSLHSISLLDENNDNIINSSDSTNFAKIFVWRDNNTDGILNTGEFTALETDASVDLNNTSSSNQGPAGNSAYILQTAEINLGASGGGVKDLYEVSLESSVSTPGNAPSWQGKDISFVTAREGGSVLKHVEFNEGLTDGSETLHLNLSSGSNLTSSHVTLITVRGLPDALSLNKGSKLENGDWLLLEEDIPVQSGDSDLKIIAQDLNFSGSFSLSAWSVTSEPLSGEATVSKPVYLVGNILPVADNPNLFVQTQGVVGEEDDTGIPITIRYELSDNSETVAIKLEINKSDVSSPTNGTSLKFTYEGGEINVSDMIDTGNTYTYTFNSIASANDAKITSLKIVPAEDYFSTESSPLNLKVSAIVTDGTVVGSPVEQTIPVVIEERADPIEISFENFANQPDDSENLSVQRNTTDTSNISLSSYEKIASDSGVIIVKTDASGNYDIFNKSLDGSNLQNTEIQSLRFEISGIAEDTEESSAINQFILQVDDKSFVPKVDLVNNLQTFTFSIPSLEADKAVKLITPENYDSNVTFKIYSIVSANGDTALSQPININVNIFSDGSPADVSVTSSTAIEDGPAFRLPLTITLNDTSENVKNLKLDSSDLSEVLYLTRLQNLTLDGFSTSLDGISFDNNFLSSPELVIRFSNNFKSSLEVIGLEQQIKTLFEAESDVSSKVSNVESLFQSFGLNKNTHWSFYAKGQTLDSNGVEETVFEQLDYNNNFIRSNILSNLEKKEYVENSISSDFMTKVGDVFTIDIQQLASNISPNGASQDILKEAQIWLSGKLGGKVNPDTSSSFDVNVTVITEDNDNIDSNFDTSLFSDRTLLGQTQQTLSVNFVETNDLPVVTNVDNDMIYHEGGDHVLLITNATFSDEDNTNFNGGTISAKLNSPISGDNIFIFNSASITLSGTGDIIDGQNVVGVKDANDIVIGQLQKLFSDDGRDVIGFNVTLNEEADANDITAILHSIGYSNSGTISDVRDVSYKVSIEDGSGPDINGNASTEITGNIVTINPQPSREYIEGNTLASNDVTETTVDLFTSINLSDNGFVPDQIQLNVKDFILGDVISTSSTLVTSSYDNQSGVLTLTSPVGSSDAEKLASFHDGINKSTYSSTNDNPTQLFVDQEHSITNERIIEVKSIDNSSSLTVDEGRIVGTFKINITSNDDLPDFNLNNFNTVKFVPQEITAIVNGQEVTVNELRSSSTQLLPNVLVEENDQDALGLTIYGSSSSKIFDPDSLINEVIVEITSTDPSSELAAKSQDKLTFKPSSDNLFTVVGEEGKSSLTISLSQEVTDVQTNSSNQVMLENALRSVHYENEVALTEIISGFRDVKITIKDIEGVSTVIYDSKNVAEDNKILNIGSNEVGNNNILPSITGIDNQVSFHEGTEHIFLISEGTIIDQNDTNFSGGVLKISLISPFEGEKIDIIDNDLVSSNNNKIVNTSNNAIEYGHFFNKTSNEIVFSLTEAQLDTLTDGLPLDAGLYSIVQDTGNTSFYLQSVVQNEEDSFTPIDQSNLIKLHQNYQSQNDVDNFINSENIEQQGFYHRVEMLVNFSTSGNLQNENAVGVTEVQAILRSIGYKLDTPISSDFNEGSSNYKITIHDGSGINVTGNLFNEFNGEIIRSKQESNVSYNEGLEFAIDDLGNTETNLFSNINLKGSGFPDVIQVVITDFKEGDVLRINNDDVDQSFNTGSGILTISNPLGADNSSKITSFQNALNNVLYSSSNDNPDFQLMDVERSTDLQRLIEIKVLDNQGTGDINEARTIAKIKVDITSVDDKPFLSINNFNRVQLVQKTVTEIVADEEVEVTGLRVESTQLLPVSLLDQPGVNALSNSSFGVSSEGMIFDPDSMINEISIEIVSSDLSTSELAEQQDKLLFNKSSDNNFEIVGDQGNPTLTLSLSQDIIDGQTNAENQAMVEQTLRSIYYENDKPLSEIISGFRDVKITFKDTNDLSTVVYDTANVSELPKILIGKAFEPGDTHNTLSIPLSNDQIDQGQIMAKIQFTIITDTGSPDLNDELFIVDQDENIINTIQNIGISESGYALYEWQPQNDLNNTQIIDILKSKIAFGGKHFTAEGLRTIELKILDENDNSIGPAGLRTAIFIQEHSRDGISGVDQGDIIARSDSDVSEDVIHYSSSKQYPLTIDLNTGKTYYSSDETSQVNINGFEHVVGSSQNDLIITDTEEVNRISGGSGNDIFQGGSEDYLDYSLEDAYPEEYKNGSGINANLSTGTITDTYGDVDQINNLGNEEHIKNIIGTQNDDIIYDSNEDNIILGGYGQDKIFSSGGNDNIKGGLGDDIIEIGEGNDTIYGDDEITSGGKDKFIFKGEFGFDTIEDFEINNDKIIVELNDQDQGIELEGIETNSVKIKKISQNSQENTITLNSAAGIITASTLALATTEVMGLTTFTDVTSNQNIDGNDDILDFSKITDSLVIDLDLKSFQQLSSGLQFNFDGYENIVGGSDIDQISRVVSSQDIIGIVGGKGNDQITGLNQDILRYDLEDKYRDNNDAVNGVNVDLLNQIALDTYGNSDQISGIDNVYGTSYDDLLKGNENGNTLLGYSGNDILKGYGGNDIIVGGSGADIIDGGAGNDLLTGDDGYYQNADLFIFKGASENLSDFGEDIVTDFEVGIDKARIYLTNSDQLTGQESLTGTTVSTGQASVDFQWSRYEQLDKYNDLMDAVQEIRVLSNNLVNLDGQKAAKAGEDDVLQLTKLGSEDTNGYLIDVAFEQMLSINDSSESYQLFGMQNYDIFLGSSGKDILIGSGETTSGFVGGKGDDVIYGSSLDYLAYDMEEELITEEIIGSELNNINNHVKVNLGDGSVDLNGIFVDARTAEDIWGSNDELIGIENVNATSGNDYVFGSDNSNTIVTGEGNDFIYGGKGNDILDGGSGSDKFVFLQSDLEASNDQDSILNFNKDEDTLTFDTLGIEDVSVSFIDDSDGSAADTIISFDNNSDWGSIILVDVGRLDKDELNIDTDTTVGGLG